MAQRLATRAEICGPLGTPGGVAGVLNAATDADVTTWSTVAALVCEPRRWRGLCSEGHALLTAHFLAVTPGLGLVAGGGAWIEELGPVASEADGPASRSFGAVVGVAQSADITDAMLGRSPWGLAFLQLRLAVRGFGSVCVANGVNTVGH